jgi:outer membrane protein assembly factor BamB
MRLSVILLLLLLSGCSLFDAMGEGISGITDYFLGGTDNTEPPTPLLEYEPEVNLDILWKESVGVGTNQQLLRLVPAVGVDKIYAADNEGLVQARQLSDGDLLWETDTELEFAGGPGLGAGILVLGTSNAEVVALNQENGDIIWKAAVSSEVLSVPTIFRGVVIVRTTDGSVVALNEKTGEVVWSYVRSVPALSIRGTSSPIVVEDNVITGEDNGKLMALRLSDGKFVWETSIAVPQGRSEIERLVDLDVDPIERNGVIYVASYHGGVGAVSELAGDVLWRKEDISSGSGLSSDGTYLYLTNSESHVMQLDRRTGTPLWKQQDLQYRNLTSPSVYRNYVVVGDLEGYVHWLSSVDGRQLARIQITKNPINTTPLIANDIVYIYASDGTLAALRIQ